MSLKVWDNFKTISSSNILTRIIRRRSTQQTLVAAVLTAGAVAMTASCATLRSLPPVPYGEIQRVRQEFLGGRTVGLSYSPVAWDSMADGTPPPGRHAFGLNPDTGKYELAFYVRLKNLSDARLRIAPMHFSLFTVKGVTYFPGPATPSTSRPFPTTELSPQASTEGYVVFELPPDALAGDQPSLVEYNDGAGNHAVRYLSIADMMRYEGLASAESREATGHWQNRWVPGHWYGGVWYPGRYETFWVEGRKE